jgi:hypothetical protein
MWSHWFLYLIVLLGKEPRILRALFKRGCATPRVPLMLTVLFQLESCRKLVAQSLLCRLAKCKRKEQGKLKVLSIGFETRLPVQTLINPYHPLTSFHLFLFLIVPLNNIERKILKILRILSTAFAARARAKTMNSTILLESIAS